ncbi:hypothetical protein [Pseudomonas sp. PDM13]|uniref:hypothetical protein n=1 Tax=Pseudomonas sp. PDM13 TaxID=2769255 RepID=UPI0021E023BB|nr:hypothetical protein [Pseudomonas sp. PDM13]MCU9948257.1 hypothetical protein [Pseudomonas sp. PDM13]MCU9948272.1 hypothetical protein [Pseudomonas sp. PDM13]
MKAPTRFLFGWVIYLALFMAINPVMAFLFQLANDQPLALTIASATFALVALWASFFLFLRRFWRWADKPRATAQNLPGDTAQSN